METTDDPRPVTAEVEVALGQKPQYLAMVRGLDRAKPRCPKRRNGDRVSIIGVVLVRPLGGEHPDARRQGGRHIEHVFTPSDELLGQKIPQPAGRLDGPGALVEWLRPTHQLVHLSTGGTHLEARELIFIPVDRHRSVRCLVGIDADHHIHDYLLGCVGKPRGALLLADCLCSILF